VSALISAVVLTYITVTAPGCFACQAVSCSGVMESASEQPASRSGIRTVLSGDRIDAVSAMKCTPQNAMTEASVRAARWLSPSESPT